MRRHAWMLLFLVSACAAPVVDQGPGLDEHVAGFEAAIQPALVFTGEPEAPMTLEQRMAYHRVPGLSVAVILDGRIAWAEGYGLADVASARPVTTDTLFQAASISKPVAAMAALRLVQEGRIGLDQDVNEKLTAWTVPDYPWSATRPVTLRGLLSHSAGTTVHGFPGYRRGTEIPSAVGVLRGDGNTDPVVVDVEPGTLYRYSGGGYTIVQQLLVDLEQDTFPAIMRRSVLEPLGMTSSTFEQPLPDARWSETATAYHKDGSPLEGDWHVYPELAAAGLWTTPTDLARFALSIQQARSTGDHPVLTAEWIEAMLTPVVGEHGLGPGVDEDSFGHGGSNEGYRCTVGAALDGSWGFAAMTNSDTGSQLVREVLLTLAREYGWPGLEPREIELVDLSDRQLARCAGSYDFPGYGVVTLTAGSDRLLGVLPDGTTFELRPMSEERFIDPEDGQELTFAMEDGEVTAMVVSDTTRAPKID